MSIPSGVTECIINTDPGVSIECVATPDGSIAVQTQIGTINILLRRVEKRENHQIATRIQLTACTTPNNCGRGTVFFFEGTVANCTRGENTPANRDKQRDIGADQVILDGQRNDANCSDDETISDTETTTCNSASANAGSASTENLNDAEPDNTTSSGAPKNQQKSKSSKNTEDQRKPEKQIDKPRRSSDQEQEIKRVCATFAEKIEGGVDKKRLAILDELLADLPAFFGRSHFDSPVQLAYHSLNASEKRHNLYQDPFYKMMLSLFRIECLSNVTESDTTKLSRRKTYMYRMLDPGIDDHTREKKKLVYQQIGRYMKQGDVLLQIMERNAGLVLVIYEFLNTNDFDFLWAHRNITYVSELHWLGEKISQLSKKYSPAANYIFNLLRSFRATNSKRTAEDCDQDQLRKRKCHVPSADRIEEMMLRKVFDDSIYLLFLGDALGNSVPELLLKRSESEQLRWNDEGVEQRVTASSAGLDTQLVNILSNSERLGEALKYFILQPGTTELWTISPDTRIPTGMTEQEKMEWSVKALKWICFAFPRIRQQESQYDFVVRSLLPPLNRLLEGISQNDELGPLQLEVAEVLLAASKVDKALLSRVANYLDEDSPIHLRAELALERSCSARLDGNFDSSNRIIHDFCCPCRAPNDQCLPHFFREHWSCAEGRLRALYGLLHRSHLENLMLCGHYNLAEQQLDDWRMPSNPSSMELTILPTRALTSCKVFRSKGDFEAIRDRLAICLKVFESRPRQQIRSQIVCQLIDAYSDLKLPQLSSDLMRPEIKKLRERSPRSKALRRILVSSIDVELQQNHYDQAKEIVEELLVVFGTLQIFDISDELLHIRLLIASARVNYHYSQFSQAIEVLRLSLHCLHKYASFEGEGFTYAVVHLSKALMYLKLGNVEEARTSFNEGRRILDTGARDFWIPTLMHWFSDVMSTIYLETRWR